VSTRCYAITLVAILLVGCKSYEGIYSPACVAFAGSTIELSDGRFVWEKFTDSVVVDDAGKAVDQFPGYPMHGSYRIDERTVHMEADSGESIADMYLHRHDGRYFLLTAEQLEALESGGNLAECALALGGNTKN
jgi:hypothetical protein